MKETIVEVGKSLLSLPKHELKKLYDDQAPGYFSAIYVENAAIYGGVQHKVDGVEKK